MNNQLTITTNDGLELDFEFYDSIELKGQLYIGLIPVLSKERRVCIYKVSESYGNASFYEINDTKLKEKIIRSFANNKTR